jgi:hypothetical protein
MKDNTQTQGHITPVVLDREIFEHENEWVALDADNRLVDHAKRLHDLLTKLSPEEEAQGLTFMQVFPRGMSFVGSRV